MNISKINSASFNGRLIIQDCYNRYSMDAKHIGSIIDDTDKKETRIYNYCDFGSRDRYLSIPYSVIPPNKILTAYAAAQSAYSSDSFVLKNTTKGKCTFVG